MSEYEFLTAETAGGYVAAHPDLAHRIDTADLASVREVGDGNLNLVFILRDGAGRGLVLKQALPYVRLVGPDWPMSPERAGIEARTTRLHAAAAPGLVPEIYSFDEGRHIIAMEDLSDHQVWRTALNAGERHDGVAAVLGRYMAAVAFDTSVLGLSSEEHKALLAGSSNPDLCRITEDLVLTEPWVDAGRNAVLPANEPDAAELAADSAMVAEIGRAKWMFLTQAEALLHGDLHTGSVMVRSDGFSVKAFDSEFAYYGPVSFDVGMLWANFVIAAARAVAQGDDERAAWALGLCAESWDAFEAELRARWPRRHDPRVYTDAVLADLLDRWRRDAWLFGAAELSRRMVGLAKTSDVETLPENLREGAVRGVLQVARRWVRERHADADVARAASIAGELLAKHATR